jgi:hypothetical protein
MAISPRHWLILADAIDIDTPMPRCRQLTLRHAISHYAITAFDGQAFADISPPPLPPAIISLLMTLADERHFRYGQAFFMSCRRRQHRC